LRVQGARRHSARKRDLGQYLQATDKKKRQKGAAHDDESLDETRQFGLAHDRKRDIGQRAGRAENEAAGMRTRRGDDRIRRMHRVRGLFGLRQNRVAEAGLAVNLACVLHRDGHRRRRSWPDRNAAAPGKRQNRARVARGGREGNVAHHSGDAQDLRLVMSAGVEEREGVIDACVDVDDERLSEFGHEGNLPGGAGNPRCFRQMRRT